MNANRQLHPFLFVVCAMVIAACSSARPWPGGGPQGNSAGDNGGASDDSGVTADDGGSTAEEAGQVTMGDAGGGPTVTLTMGPFTVPPSSEVFKCQNFANPFGGKDVDIAQWDEHMTTGSHHMFLFFAAGAQNGPIQDCPAGGVTFGPYPFGAQSPDATLNYPPGVGSRIAGTMGFMLNAHFVNATATAFQATITVTAHLAAPGSIKQYAGVVFMNNISLVIPPDNLPTDAPMAAILPQDMYVMQVNAHMHKRSTNFVAKTPTQTLYTTQVWADAPPKKYDPPMHLSAGTPITWDCTYVNDTLSPLYFGESADRNVMCIFFMQFYPADPNNPTIQFQL
jgi:hypothetical protein